MVSTVLWSLLAVRGIYDLPLAPTLLTSEAGSTSLSS